MSGWEYLAAAVAIICLAWVIWQYLGVPITAVLLGVTGRKHQQDHQRAAQDLLQQEIDRFKNADDSPPTRE